MKQDIKIELEAMDIMWRAIRIFDLEPRKRIMSWLTNKISDELDYKLEPYEPDTERIVESKSNGE